MVTSSLPDDPKWDNERAKDERRNDGGGSPLGQATAGKAERNQDQDERSNE